MICILFRRIGELFLVTMCYLYLRFILVYPSWYFVLSVLPFRGLSFLISIHGGRGIESLCSCNYKLWSVSWFFNFASFNGCFVSFFFLSVFQIILRDIDLMRWQLNRLALWTTNYSVYWFVIFRSYVTGSFDGCLSSIKFV